MSTQKQTNLLNNFINVIGNIFTDGILNAFYKIFIINPNEECPRIVGWGIFVCCIFAGFCTYKCATTPFSAAYCEITTNNDHNFNLVGVREWVDPNNKRFIMGEFKTFDEAFEKAKKINCPFR